MKGQYSFFDNIYVDNFAGGGGASTGIELATGKPVDIAINHDESAIMMHKRNHPFTEHYKDDVWNVDPIEAVRGRHVGLAWFSPDCKHFSRAKGAALVDKKIRGLAWVVLKWAGKVRPDVIMLENVPEFVTWGPVRKGKPVKKKAGQTYKKWYKQLSELGYVIESRVLCAADYGAPTIRKRFCLIARCDGKPIVFPKRTHAPKDSEEVRSGILKPWRAAAEIIDWSLPCYSIFESKQVIKEKYGVNTMRPLKPNTLRRIAKGLDKFVLKSAEPFIVPRGYGENKYQEPRTHDINEPLSTIVSSVKQYVCDPVIMPYEISNNSNNVPHSVNSPLSTVTTGNRNLHVQAVATPVLLQHKFNNGAQSIKKPLSTITSVCAHEILCPSLIQYHSEQSKKETRGQHLNEPIRTIDGSGRYGLSAMHLTQYFSGDGHYHSVDEPLATITTMEREGVVAAHLAHFMGKDKGQPMSEPLMSLTAQETFAQINTKIVKWDENCDLGYWNEVRKLLNEYCDYNIKEDEILLLNVFGVWHFISDIGLRMLTPRELYDAMGFPDDYIIDKDIYGNTITRSEQVARCGNAVCPPMASAMVRANIDCTVTVLPNMRELHRQMTF